MREFHIHLHLDRELLADPHGSLHLHIKPEGPAWGGKGHHKHTVHGGPHVERSGYEAAEMHSGTMASKYETMGSGSVGKASLRGEQRIRTKMYRMDFVPSTEHDSKAAAPETLQLADCDRLVLELATGNQIDPIVWESFEPSSHRGLWRLSIREDYGRWLGIVTHARDPRAIWVLADWTPRGTLILEPTEPQHYPRLMLTPLSAFHP